MMVGGANHPGAGWRQHSFPLSPTLTRLQVLCLPVCPMQLSPIMRPPRVDSVQNTIGYLRDSSPMQHSYDYLIYIPAITCFRHLLSSFSSFSASRLLVVLRRGSFLLQ